MTVPPSAVETFRLQLAEQQRELAEHRTECLQVRREATVAQNQTNLTLVGLSGKIETIEKMPGKIARTLGAIIIAGAALTNIITYLTHEETAQKAGQAVAAAQQATAVSAQGQSVIVGKLNAISAAQTNAAGP